MSNTYYDNHTLYIKCDCATVSQISEVLNEAIKKYQTDNAINLNCSYRINLVKNKEGISLGVAFVFISNPEVYHMILGKNPDGTDRFTYIDDQQKDWPDDIKVPVPLEPLIILPSYNLTSSQIEIKRNKIIEENSSKKDFDPSIVKIDSHAYLNVYRAMVSDVEPKYMPNILKCLHVPDWVTKEDIKAKFIPYASNNKTIQDRTIKGRHFIETYPFVNIKKDRVAFVIFNSCTRDAQFALYMCKKTLIEKQESEKTLKATLMFFHSYRTDRDIMTQVNKQPNPSYNKTKQKTPKIKNVQTNRFSIFEKDNS